MSIKRDVDKVVRKFREQSIKAFKERQAREREKDSERARLRRASLKKG